MAKHGAYLKGGECCTAGLAQQGSLACRQTPHKEA